MGNELAGKRAIVTGAAQGIGAALARVLAGAGCGVTLVDRLSEVEAVADHLGGTAFVGDVAEAPFVREVVDATNGVDILVNNAGEVRVSGPLDDWDKALNDYDRLVDSNFRGAYLFGRAVAPGMAAGGNIINVSTDHVKPAPEAGWHHGHGAMDLYNATKWALNGLTFDWAKALRSHGIRVNNICIGATDTAMLRGWLGDDPDPDYLATWMSPEAVAEVVLELVNEGPTGRTGENIALWAGHPTVLPEPVRAKRGKS